MDNKHVVFGEVTSGYDVVEKMESMGNSSGSVKKPVKITDCGVLWKRYFVRLSLNTLISDKLDQNTKSIPFNFVNVSAQLKLTPFYSLHV